MCTTSRHLFSSGVSSLTRVQLLRPRGQRSLTGWSPWDSPGKNTGVGCHFPLFSSWLCQLLFMSPNSIFTHKQLFNIFSLIFKTMRKARRMFSSFLKEIKWHREKLLELKAQLRSSDFCPCQHILVHLIFLTVDPISKFCATWAMIVFLSVLFPRVTVLGGFNVLCRVHSLPWRDALSCSG